eukprot:5392498-Amphidinium_carterae.1
MSTSQTHDVQCKHPNWLGNLIATFHVSPCHPVRKAPLAMVPGLPGTPTCSRMTQSLPTDRCALRIAYAL